MSGQRVVRTHGALYGKPRRSRRKRYCHGHLAASHDIKVGDWCVTSSLPPNDPEFNNDGWWHMTLCSECWPADISIPNGGDLS